MTHEQTTSASEQPSPKDVTARSRAQKAPHQVTPSLVPEAALHPAAGPQALKFVIRIDPGITVKDTMMLFDVAPGTKVANIELHDTPLTQGVRVKLP